MGCQTDVELENNLTFSICTHDPDTGVLTDADAVPDYRVYEDETAGAILTGSMAKLDDANTTGFYSEQIACTAANGFEDGKSYSIYIVATVDGDTGGIAYNFTVKSKRAREGADGDTLETLSDQLDAVVADTNELQGDWTDGGRLDLILDELTTQGDTNEGKIDTIDSNVDAILVDTGTDGVVVAAASKTGYTLSDAGVDAIFDRNSSISISFENLIERTYQMLNNRMAVSESAPGTATLRNIGDTADLATGAVASSSGTTTRNELTWT